MKRLLIPFFILIITQFSYSQKKALHSIFLLGNMNNVEQNDPIYQNLQTQISSANGKRTVLFLGDFLDKNGIENIPLELEKSQLENLIQLDKSGDKMLFFPGDAEWNSAKIGGLEKLNDLDDYLKERLDKDLLITDDGCPGPKEIKLGKNLVMIAINSHWFLHPKTDRPEEEDVVCDNFNETVFWEEVEGIIKGNDGKNIIIAAHHPAISYGQYAGYKLTKQHFLPPVIGSFVAAYHKNVGNRRDLSRAPIKRFAGKIVGLLERYPSVVCVSGHELDLQIQEKKGNFYLNSGSIGKGRAVSQGEFTVFKSNKRGFIALKYFDDGSVETEVFGISKDNEISSLFSKKLMESSCLPHQDKQITNERFRPCPKGIIAEKANEIPAFGSTAAGEKYLISNFGQKVLGEHYRTSWAASLKEVPYLPVDTLFGGLQPYAKGGGGQTHNLKFKTETGEKFSFRSIDKNPTRRKDKELTSGVYGDIVRDLVASQHPYGPLVLGELMDEAGIPHSQPKLYLMPNSVHLGNYREEFAEMLGYLEIKPKGKSKKNFGFLDADEVEGTLSMIQDLLDDNDNYVDQKAYAKARLFDMWVADWDRHHDNWKWLGYEYDDGKGTKYLPFPKDRDKALAKLEGIYDVMDWEFVAKDIAKLEEDYGGLKSLNHKARNLDRIFGNKLNKEDWETLAKELQTEMTDEVIQNATKALPTDAQEHSGEYLQKVLKIRRDNLLEVTEQYYKMLANEVDIIGSDKAEIFDIERLENGNVRVIIHDKSKEDKRDEKLYERLFLNEETKEIRLYGLGADDDFHITGKADESILVRIIPGKGEDLIEDNSSISAIRKMTKIYNNNEKETLKLGEEAVMMKSPEMVKLETEKLFNYNYHLVLPTFSYNIDDGFGIGLTGNYTRQKFNKPGFGSKYSISLNATAKKIYSLGLSAQYRHVIKKWDLTLGISATNRDRFFRHFYGLGNSETDLKDQDFYENETTSFTSNIGLIRQFPHENKRSSFAINLVYETRDLDANPNNSSDASIYDNLTNEDGKGVVTLRGIRSNLNLDFRDSGNFPTKGTQFKFENFSFLNSSFNHKIGGRLSAESSIFFTTHQLKKPITLSLRGGAIHSYGKVPFYYKSFIGQENNHRGFRRNRFGGETAAYLNSELRWHIGTIYTPLVPLYVGVLGLYDAGRVWSDVDPDSDILHTAIGGGFYVIPYADSFNLNFTVAKSDEGEVLFNFKVGFFVK